MAVINNGNDIKKDSTKITCWKFQKKGRYANYWSENKAETDTDTDSSRQSGSANAKNGI